jgi:spore coat polysaccharide biosynthesis protein SpsF
MNIGAIVQARMTSQRLPKKSLLDLNGKPLLQYILERLEKCSSFKTVVVATSSDPSDDPIADFCKQMRVECYRGSLTHVAERFDAVARAFSLSAFVRLSGDSPLLDHVLIDRAVDLFNKGDWDLVTNIQKRSYPKGQSVEVCCSITFAETLPCMTTDEDREHVTAYYYRNPSKFKIYNMEAEENHGALQLSVDTAADLKTISSIVSLMTRPHWEYRLEEIIQLHRQVSAGAVTQ